MKRTHFLHNGHICQADTHEDYIEYTCRRDNGLRVTRFTAILEANDTTYSALCQKQTEDGDGYGEIVVIAAPTFGQAQREACDYITLAHCL